MSEQTKQEQIENWLEIGFYQSQEKISETFYFDKRDREFFSILISDNFLFDDNFRINLNTNSNYSEETLKLLADRMHRIENDENSIIAIPRLGEMNEEILLSKIETFLNLNGISLQNVSIWEVEEDGSVMLNLENESRKKWWQFWK